MIESAFIGFEAVADLFHLPPGADNVLGIAASWYLRVIQKGSHIFEVGRI